MSKSHPEAVLAGQIKIMGLDEPVREYCFARKIRRRWRFDFAWPLHKVALEVDGGLFSNGRHVRGSGALADCEKFSVAAAMGWRVLRVAPQHVRSGQAIDWLQQALEYSHEKREH